MFSSGSSCLKVLAGVRGKSLTHAAYSNTPECQKFTRQPEHTEEHTKKIHWIILCKITPQWGAERGQWSFDHCQTLTESGRMEWASAFPQRNSWWRTQNREWEGSGSDRWSWDLWCSDACRKEPAKCRLGRGGLGPAIPVVVSVHLLP